MSNRFVALALCALVLSACDLLRGVEIASPSPNASGTFETVGSLSTAGATGGGAGLFSSRPLDTPSPTIFIPIATTPPPSFTPTSAPTTVPTTSARTAAPTVAATAPPTPTPSPIPAPVITGFQPEVGARGSTLFINGRNLATTRLVLFGDIAVAPQHAPTDVQVVAVVPANAVTSRISLVWASGVVTSTQFFEVLEPTAPPTPTCPIRTQCTPPPTP